MSGKNRGGYQPQGPATPPTPPSGMTSSVQPPGRRPPGHPDALARVAHAAAVQYAKEQGSRDTEPWEELPERWKAMWRRVAIALWEAWHG